MNATRRPWLPLYIDDFRASPRVGRMSLAERGAYLYLLMACWEGGGRIKDDPEILGEALDVDPEELAQALTPRVRRCFQEADGWLVNPRMLFEVQRAAAAAARQAEKGRQSAAARRERTGSAQPGGQSIPEPPPNRGSSPPEPGFEKPRTADQPRFGELSTAVREPSNRTEPRFEPLEPGFGRSEPSRIREAEEASSCSLNTEGPPRARAESKPGKAPAEPSLPAAAPVAAPPSAAPTAVPRPAPTEDGELGTARRLLEQLGVDLSERWGILRRLAEFAQAHGQTLPALAARVVTWIQAEGAKRPVANPGGMIHSALEGGYLVLRLGLAGTHAGPPSVVGSAGIPVLPEALVELAHAAWVRGDLQAERALARSFGDAARAREACALLIERAPASLVDHTWRAQALERFAIAWRREHPPAAQHWLELYLPATPEQRASALAGANPRRPAGRLAPARKAEVVA